MKQVLIYLSLLFFLAAPLTAKEGTPSATSRQEQVQVKQKIAARINQQLALIQNQAVKHFNKVLERINKLLVKIKTRVPALDTAAAQTAIDTAQAAVDDLDQNTYLIELTQESGLRVGASAAKTKLRTDIKAVKDKVQLARQAVVDLLKAAAKL